MDTNTVVAEIDGLVMNLTGEEFRDEIRTVSAVKNRSAFFIINVVLTPDCHHYTE